MNVEKKLSARRPSAVIVMKGVPDKAAIGDRYRMNDQEVKDFILKRHKSHKSVIDEDPSQEITHNMSNDLLDKEVEKLALPKLSVRKQTEEEADADYSLVDYTVLGGKKKKKRKKKKRRGAGDKSAMGLSMELKPVAEEEPI